MRNTSTGLKKKKAYDLSQFEVREQIQETFIETIPLKIRRQDPSYYELKDGKITIGVPPGGEDDDNQNKRRRPLRNRRKIDNINTQNKIGEDEDPSQTKVTESTVMGKQE